VEECLGLGREHRLGGQRAWGIAGTRTGRTATIARSLDQVKGNAFAITGRNGTSSTGQLKGDAPRSSRSRRGRCRTSKTTRLSGSRQWRSRTAKAVEVHVFAEPLRGAGEGHYPWDLLPNAAVTQQVKKVDGNTLSLIRLRPTGSSLGIAPVDCDPVVLLKPFGPHLPAEQDLGYIGGVIPSRPTTTTAASQLPSAFFSHRGTKILVPGFGTDRRQAEDLPPLSKF
jgi:hypothetical protein